MARRRQIYEGRSKILYEGPEAGTLVQYFKDDATTATGKKDVVTGKGVLNNRISEFLMTKLRDIGLQNHLVRRLNMREQLVRGLEMVPLTVTVRNVAAGQLSARLGIPEGMPLPRSLIEYNLKSHELGNPMVGEEHIACFGWISPAEMDEITSMSLRANDFLCGLFIAHGIRLIDIRFEFGRLYTDQDTVLVIADEISPDTCRLWDVVSAEKMDKDRFRRDLGNVAEAYREVAKRLGIMPEGGPRDLKGPTLMQ